MAKPRAEGNASECEEKRNNSVGGMKHIFRITFGYETVNL